MQTQGNALTRLILEKLNTESPEPQSQETLSNGHAECAKINLNFDDRREVNDLSVMSPVKANLRNDYLRGMFCLEVQEWESLGDENAVSADVRWS